MEELSMEHYTDGMVERLLREAKADGHADLAALCERALDGSQGAKDACWSVICGKYAEGGAWIPKPACSGMLDEAGEIRGVRGAGDDVYAWSDRDGWIVRSGEPNGAARCQGVGVESAPVAGAGKFCRACADKINTLRVGMYLAD